MNRDGPAVAITVPRDIIVFTIAVVAVTVSRVAELPRGCLVRYREWYGMKPGQPNVGVKINADVIGLSIAAREKDEKIAYGVLDPSAFAQQSLFPAGR